MNTRDITECNKSYTRGDNEVYQITYIKCNTCGNQEEVSSQPSWGGQGQERLNACSDQYNQTERIDKGNKDYCQCLFKCDRHRRELGFNDNCKACWRVSCSKGRHNWDEWSEIVKCKECGFLKDKEKENKKTKSQMKCGKCDYKKDWTEADGIPLKCPKCGEEAGGKFDIYEVPITEKDSSRKWLPWVIGGGTALILVVGIIAYFLGKSKGDKQ